MASVTRVSSMIPGVPCTIVINGRVKNYPVHIHISNKSGNPVEHYYINLAGKRYYDKDLPMGEEVMT